MGGLVAVPGVLTLLDGDSRNVRNDIACTLLVAKIGRSLILKDDLGSGYVIIHVHK